MKITMYELLGMVKDGKAPKKIKIVSNNYNREFYFDGDIYMYKDEYGEYAMTDDVSIEMLLNDEVEIIEEEKKIPEKLDKYADISGNLALEWSGSEKKLKDKIDEIIDYLKSKGE